MRQVQVEVQCVQVWYLFNKMKNDDLMMTSFVSDKVLTQNIFSLKTSLMGCIDLRNDGGLQKFPLKKKGKYMF